MKICRKIFFLLLLGLFFESAAQPSEVLSAEKINKLVPLRTKGFSRVESKSSQNKIGNLTYSLCERNFVKGKKSIKVLLFDYVDAPIMYDQTIKKWAQMKEVETDSAVFRQVESVQFTGWESYTKSDNHSQIIFGIHNRFFLTLSGENMELYELKDFLVNFDFEKFPK